MIIETEQCITVNNVEAVKQKFAKFGVTHLYHLTHKSNINNIMKHGLMNHNRARSTGAMNMDISLQSAQDRRKHLHDFVPLFFNPKNPMLYKLRDQQDDLVIIEIEVSCIIDKCFRITDGNAASPRTIQFPNSLDSLNRLPWNVINDYSWSQHEDGSRKRAAEVLVEPVISKVHFNRLICYSHETQRELEQYGKTVDIDYNYFFVKRATAEDFGL